MRSPNLNSLKMFDAAARHLNFRLAAEELSLTQGAVAQQVRRLESELGLKLFFRKARGLELTEVGKSYHRSIQRALTIIDDATRKLIPESAVITLSITPSFASKWLVPRLARFAKMHAEIEVQTVASEQLADFQTDGVDLAIRQGRPPFGDELHAELLSPIDLRAVCSPEFAKSCGPIEKVTDFAGEQLIQDSHNLWDRLLDEAALSAEHKVLQFNQTTLAMDAAANGQGVALAPRILSTLDVQQGRLVELWQDGNSEQDGYYFVHPRSRKTDLARDAFIAWAKSEVESHQAVPTISVQH